MNDDSLHNLLQRSPTAPEPCQTHPTNGNVANGAKHNFLSPSLWTNREEPAFETKILLQESQAAQIAAWAMQHLQLDPHGDPKKGHTYRVHGLYFDTPQLDVFRRSSGFKRKKFRLRRYGLEPNIYLEQKRKVGDRVIKRRTLVADEHVEHLRGEVRADDWAGKWFHHRLQVRKLQPTCLISYERQAYFGQSGDGSLRMTLDRHLHCRLCDYWHVQDAADGVPLLTGQVLLELKYRSHMPVLFKSLLQEFSLLPGRMSKYRAAIAACGRGDVACDL